MDEQGKWIAFIGSRDLTQFPPDWLTLYRAAVASAVRTGYGISTGAAPGADQLAAEIALEAQGYVRLVLPWMSYEMAWCSRMLDRYSERLERWIYRPEQHPLWTASVKLHPNAQRLTRGVRALHARNYGIVHDANVVVALPGIQNPGGTGQGIRVAQALGIKLIDLSTEEGRARIRENVCE